MSWQVVPTLLSELISDPDAAKARKAIAAMMRMKKLDIETPRRAAKLASRLWFADKGEGLDSGPRSRC